MKRMQNGAVAIGLFAGILLLVGCGQEEPAPPKVAPADGGPEPDPTVKKKPLSRPKAFTRYYPQYGFRIDAFPDWEEQAGLALPSVPLPENEQVDSVVPGLAAAVRAAADSGMLIATRFRSPQGEVVQIEIARTETEDLAQFVKDRIAAERRRPGDEELSRSDAKVSGQRAIRRVYVSDRGSRKAAAYYVLQPGRVYTIICQSATPRFEAVEPELQKIVETFQLVEPPPFGSPPR